MKENEIDRNNLLKLTDNIIVFSKFEDAICVLEACFEIYNKDKTLTVGDLNHIIGENDIRTRSRLGWKSLFEVNVKQGLNGTWIMRLPKPERLKISYI